MGHSSTKAAFATMVITHDHTAENSRFFLTCMVIACMYKETCVDRYLDSLKAVQFLFPSSSNGIRNVAKRIDVLTQFCCRSGRYWYGLRVSSFSLVDSFSFASLVFFFSIDFNLFLR